MALHPTAKATNLAKSVYDHLGGALETAGLTVDYEGVEQDLNAETEYVQLRLLDAGGGKFAGRVDSGPGLWKDVLLSVNIFVKEPLTNSYRPREIRDVVVNEIPIDALIPFKDYDANPVSQEGALRVMSVTADKSIPNDTGYFQHNVTFRLQWLEER